jgi:membrane protease YdiL (CAAX protease family)
MTTFFIAEIASTWEPGEVPQITILTAALIMLLLCLGVSMMIATIIYCMKRPFSLAEWGRALAVRSLPGRALLALLAGLVVLNFAVSIAYASLSSSTEIDPHLLVFQMLFFQVPALLIVFAVCRAQPSPALQTLGLASDRVIPLLGLSVLFYFAMLPVIGFCNFLYQLLLQMLGISITMQDVLALFLGPMSLGLRILILFAAIIGAPVYEEIVFRGLIFPWAVRRAGFWPATVAVSLFFAILHLHVPSMLPLFLLSVMFCIAYTRTRSLWVPIGMHACFNAVSVLLMMLLG